MGLISRVSSRTYRKFPKNFTIMADAPKKRRTFKKFSYRGVEMDKLLDMNSETLHKMFNCRHRRSFNRGVSRRHNTVIKRMRIAKKNCPALEKPKPVKTHCRNLTILPEMVGTYLGEYAITYKPTKHGRAGIGATHSSR